MKNILFLALFLFLPFNAITFAQRSEVTGVIEGFETPVKEMTVTASGSSVKVHPSKSGRFNIKVASLEQDTIFVATPDSLLQIPLEGNDQLYIAFASKEKIGTINDIILINKKKKEHVNAAYGGTLVTRSTLEKTGETNLLKAISMRVAGVEYTRGNLLIRGAQSFSGDIYPLYVINGVETYDASHLTVQEIESVEVVKGSDASLFGVKGTNGVIIIKTTKF